VHGLRCCGNIAPRVLAVDAHLSAYRRTRNVSKYMLVLAVVYMPLNICFVETAVLFLSATLEARDFKSTMASTRTSLG